MASATVTSKGQITIPATIRQAMGLQAGQVIEFVPTERGGFELHARNKPASALKGMIKASRSVSIEEMNEAVKNRTRKL